MARDKKQGLQWKADSGSSYAEPTTNVRLRLVYIDWVSTLKISFLVGIVQAVVIIIATAILHVVIVQTGIFAAANAVLGSVIGGSGFDVNTVLSFGQSVGFAAVIGILNLLVLTILGALFAIIYNLIARMTGGIKIGFTNK